MRDILKGAFVAFLIVVASCAFGAAGFKYWQVSSADRLGAGTKFQMSNVGTTLPATCTVGETYFKTDATAGINLYGCSSTNTWTVVGAVAAPALPTGTIAFFNAACPTGWSEYTALRGRVPVGLASGGTLEATVGTALTNSENRAVGVHFHTSPTVVHNHTYIETGATHAFSYGYASTTGASLQVITGVGNNSTTVSATSDASVNNPTYNAGTVAGTNAPYVQLRACRVN